MTLNFVLFRAWAGDIFPRNPLSQNVTVCISHREIRVPVWFAMKRFHLSTKICSSSLPSYRPSWVQPSCNPMGPNGCEGKWCVPGQDLDHTNLPAPPCSSPSCGWRPIMILKSLKSLVLKTAEPQSEWVPERLRGTKILCLCLLTWNIHFCFTLRWEENKPSLCLSYDIF